MLDLAKACMEHAVRKLNGTGYTSSDIQAIGVTNQRETTLAWDKLTGLPLYPAIIWSDARTTETVQKLAATSDKGMDALRSVCGLPLTNYFSAVKMRWLLDNIPMVAEAQEQGRLQFGTLDTWLIYVSVTILSLHRRAFNSPSFISRISQVALNKMAFLLLM